MWFVHSHGEGFRLVLLGRLFRVTRLISTPVVLGGRILMFKQAGRQDITRHYMVYVLWGMVGG